MSYSILALDQDIEVYEREKVGWAKHGIDIIRVDSMSDARDALRRDSFLFIAVNADNIDYMPLLPVMREETYTPIFILTSSFTVYDQVEALHNGADVFASRQKDAEENVISALALLYRHGEQRKVPKGERNLSLGIYAADDILVLEEPYRVYVSGKRIHLTPKEFKILALLMRNRKHLFTYSTLLREVWGDEYEDSAHNLVWCQIKQLKKKLNITPDAPKRIINVHGMGYRFDP